MSERKTIVHKAIMVAALMLSVATLSFSIKVCYATIIIVIITWFFEGQRLNKLSITKHGLLLQVVMAVIFFQVLSLVFSDESAVDLPKEIAFYSLFSALLFFQLNSFQQLSFNFRFLINVRD